MRILHIGPDSPFVQFLGELFEEAVPGGNLFVTLTVQGKAASHSPRTGARVETMQDRPQYLGQLIRRLQRSDVVIAHSMSRLAALAFVMAPARTVRVWSGWGYDYYGDGTKRDDQLLLPLTQRLTEDLRSGSGPSLWRRPADQLVRWAEQRAAERTDFFSAPIPADLEIFRKRFGGFQGEYQQLTYGDVSSTFRFDGPDPGIRDVLVGNSASASSNHVDAFQLLARCDLEERRVVVPLSYGDMAYRELVVEQGRRLLGDRFEPILDHLPLRSYLEVLARCQVMVFNHRRQQGLGNIGAALYRGAHVYMREDNPLFVWLRDSGVPVRSMGALTDGLPSSRLSSGDVSQSREFLDSHWGAGRGREYVQELLKKVATVLASRN